MILESIESDCNLFQWLNNHNSIYQVEDVIQLARNFRFVEGLSKNFGIGYHFEMLRRQVLLVKKVNFTCCTPWCGFHGWAVELGSTQSSSKLYGKDRCLIYFTKKKRKRKKTNTEQSQISNMMIAFLFFAKQSHQQCAINNPPKISVRN